MGINEEDFTALVESLMLHFVVADNEWVIVFDPSSGEEFSSFKMVEGEFEPDKFELGERVKKKLEELRVMAERGASAEDWTRSLNRVLKAVE